MTSLVPRHIRSLLAVLCLLPMAMSSAQTPAPKKVLSVEDYTRWRSIDGAKLSEDAKWLVYGFRFTNTLTPDAKPVLHLRNNTTGAEVEVPDASAAAFSPDSKWLIYQVDTPARKAGGRGGATDSTTPPGTPPGAPTTPAPAQGGRGGAASPAQRRWELRELATGKVQSWKDVQSGAFSANSRHLLLRRRAATGAAAGGANAAKGTDAVLIELATGRSIFMGSVGEAAFDRSGNRLAYTVDAAVRDGNGLFVMNLQSGRTDPLDNDSLRYARLTWNEKGTVIAVLKAHDVDKMKERASRLLIFTDPTPGKAPVVLDPATTAGFPKGFEINERTSFEWSDDGSRLFLSIIPQSATPDTSKRKGTDSLANVDVWNTQDERIQSVQMNQADADRNRSYRQAFEIATSRFVLLADSAMRELDLPLAGEWAIGRNPIPYISDYKRPAADFYRVNTRTGERTKFLTGQLTGAHVGGISSNGKFFLYWKNEAWQAYDLAAGISRPLAVGKLSFTSTEFDNPGPKPSYGISGFASDGSGVIIPQRFDLWLVPFDSTAALRNLTSGTGLSQKIVFRLIRPEPIDSSMLRASRVMREYDLSKPLTLSAYGEFTKKAGFYRLANGQLKSLVYEDASFSNPTRAADVMLYTRQTFSEFPDLLLSGPDLASPKKVTDANPQQAEYRWGKRILFDFVTKRGDKLQGILALPDDYVAGQKLPMLVTFYEKNSQTMHRYPTPSYITGMGAIPTEAVSRGYATMLPDVAFHTGSSHSDMLDAVESATKKVIEMGYVDPKRIGVHGHSYGGEGAAFIGTRSRLFAAVGMGAGVTDLFSDFNQSWGWTYQVNGGSGANGNDYYLFGQGRWGFSPWEKPEVYHFESALTHVPEITAPFLIMHGTADPTVSFTEGMNFYNALRYNGKNAVMLAYQGEGHGLSGLANRKDLTIRYFEFFDHYLKGAPAPKWMTEGVPFLVKDVVKTP